MSGIEIAAIVISAASIALSCLSAYFSIHAARVRRDTAKIRAERSGMERRSK